jgi:hypothetical protein
MNARGANREKFIDRGTLLAKPTHASERLTILNIEKKEKKDGTRLRFLFHMVSNNEFFSMRFFTTTKER